MLTSSGPLVCICVPNYNNEKTITETMDSLVNQTYKNLIIKVFDNASTDGSLKILRKYEKDYNNIEIFESKKNIGGEANYTRCIENMHGDYSSIYHSDDVYLPNIVEEQVEFLEKNQDCVAVLTNSYVVDENGSFICNNFFPKEFKSDLYTKFDFIKLLRSIIKHDSFLQCPSALVRTIIYKREITKWEIEDFKTASDVSVWLRLALSGKVAIINKPLFKYRYSDQSFSFRVLANRLNKKDLFNVLDFYMSKYSNVLGEYDIKNYHFLNFKEQVFLARNHFYLRKNFDIMNSIRFDLSIIYRCITFRNGFKYLVAFLVFFLYFNFLKRINKC